MSDELKKISVVSLFVEDVQATKTFYQDVFGVSVAYEDDAAAGLQFENVMINLVKVEEAAGLVAPAPVASREAGSRFQVSIWVADVDAVCLELKRRGVDLVTEPTDQPWGMRTATFVDPAGNSWEVAAGIGGEG